MKSKKISTAIIGVILTLCMVMSLMPHMVFAAGETTVKLTALEGTFPSNSYGPDNLVDGKKADGDPWSMILSEDGAYAVVSASDVVKVKGYTFTTWGAVECFPKDWVLYGCNDYTGAGSGTWTAIDTKTDNTDMKDINTDYSFSVSDAGYYKYYKLHITALQKNNLLQLAEMAFTYETCEHSWSAESTVSEATATEPKYVQKTCTTAGGCGVTATFAVGVTYVGGFAVKGGVLGDDFTYENKR